MGDLNETAEDDFAFETNLYVTLLRNQIKDAAQETAALREENERLKEAVKELIPMAEHLNVIRIADNEWMDRKKAIENAKKLTSK